MGWQVHPQAETIASDGPRPPRNQALQGGKALNDSMPNTVRLGCLRRSGRRMTAPDNRASAGACDADFRCQHVPCFQVRLDGTRPRQAHRRANACAYHVADVIEAVRAWAAEHGVADGALTILAIEPAAGARQPPGEDQPDLRGFAFSRIPLGSGPRGDPQPAP